MDFLFQTDCIANLEKHEGRVAHMYVDSVGVVTVGCGHAIFTSQAAVALPFRLSSDGSIASQAAIAAVWAKFRYQGPSSPQKQDLSLYLEDHDIDVLLINDMSIKVPVLYRTFSDFSLYPEGVKVALMDICFNCGSFAKWPKLKEAVLAHDWKLAAVQSFRPQVSKERNEDTRDQFLEAANEEK